MLYPQLSNMMMTESLPKEPLAFQIIRFDNQKITYQFMVSSVIIEIREMC